MMLERATVYGDAFVEQHANADSECQSKTDGANCESLFARKPQISLAFGPQESDGRDVLRIDPPIG